MKSARAVFMFLASLSVPIWNSAEAADVVAANNTKYLALGDSVAFGFKPGVPVRLENYEGYVDLISDAVHKKVANASCFGESSGSFLSSAAQDLGCKQWKQDGLPRWIPYTGTQMDYAVSYLARNKNTKLVTINIGGNDLGLLLQKCSGDPTCEIAGLPGVLAAYGSNLTEILSRIRFEAGYKGPIILLTYYVSNYNDVKQVGALSALNAIASGIATAFGAKVADGFGAFQSASASHGGDACAAGLLAQLPGGTCDTHPSSLGHRLLAQAVIEVSGEK